MEQRIKDLEAALKPFADFERMFQQKPMRGGDDAIYGIHRGTEWEAEITHTHCRRAIEVLDRG